MLLEEGLLIKMDNVYKFSHDRIQEAAYSLISVEDRIKQHHQIGRMVLERTNTESLPLKVFFIVNQLNAARLLIDSDSEQLE